MKQELKITQEYIRSHKKKRLHNIFYKAYMVSSQATPFDYPPFESKRDVIEFWLDDEVILGYGIWEELPPELQQIRMLYHEFGIQGLMSGTKKHKQL